MRTKIESILKPWVYSPSKLYLAGEPTTNLLLFAVSAQQAGFSVVNSLDEKSLSWENNWGESQALALQHAKVRLGCLEVSDTLILFGENGREELGWWLGKGRTQPPLQIGGDRESVFNWLDNTQWTLSAQAALAWLKGEQTARKERY